MINPYVLLAAVLALCGSVAGGYWWGSQATQNAIEAQDARDEKLAQKIGAAAQQGAATAIAQIEVKHVVVNQKLQTEIREKPVYRDCVADVGVLDLTNEAITGQPQPPGGSQLPRTITNDRPDIR